MILCRDPLTRLNDVDLGADVFDYAHELVANGHGDGNGGLRSLVPVDDVEISSADRRLGDPDQHVVGFGGGALDFLEPDTWLASSLDERLHATMPSSLPTLMKAATAWSTCSGVWAADICVRILASPSGTIGNENPMT